MKRWAVIGWLAPVALMLLLVTSNVRITANSLYLYEQLFERNQVPARTGITIDGLRDVARQIQDYFNSDTEPLRVTGVVNGVERELFRTDEVAHMSDVKQLFVKTYRVQAISGLLLLVLAGMAAKRHRRGVWVPLAQWVRQGAAMSAIVIVLIGIASVVAFDQVFSLFHYIGFPEGNFLFDTRTDYLVRVFPFGFWEDITLVIGILTLLEAALLFSAASAAPIVARRWEQRRPNTPVGAQALPAETDEGEPR
jgi:integral membrane protein (TIGR01906 family)